MSDYAKKFTRAIAIRAIKTICQAAIAGIGTAVVMGDINIQYVLSSSAVAGILSILTSISVGLPEVKMPSYNEES